MTDQELFDRFKYPNGTLKNKRGITDATELARLEFQMVNANMVALLQHAAQFPRIETINQLTVVHRFLFDDLYAWAGEVRNYNLAKAGHVFQDFHTFRETTRWINSLLSKANQEVRPPAPMLNYWTTSTSTTLSARVTGAVLRHFFSSWRFSITSTSIFLVTRTSWWMPSTRRPRSTMRP